MADQDDDDDDVHRFACHGLDSKECRSKKGICSWQTGSRQNLGVTGCVHDLTGTETLLNDFCGTEDEGTFVRAMLKDLERYGIRSTAPIKDENCGTLVNRLIAHGLLRVHALDPDGVQRFVDTWKSRVLPAFLARRLGYRHSLDELLADIDRFLTSLGQEQGNQVAQLDPSDLLHIGLEGTEELLQGSRYGPQVLKVIAAGALLSLLFLAARGREPEPIPEPVFVPEPPPIRDVILEKIVPTNETGYEIGFGLGEKLAGLYLLKKGAERIGNLGVDERSQGAVETIDKETRRSSKNSEPVTRNINFEETQHRQLALAEKIESQRKQRIRNAGLVKVHVEDTLARLVGLDVPVRSHNVTVNLSRPGIARQIRNRVLNEIGIRSDDETAELKVFDPEGNQLSDDQISNIGTMLRTGSNIRFILTRSEKR